MAIISANLGTLFLDDFDFGDLRYAEVYRSQPKHYQVEWSAGEFYDFYGDGFKYDGSGILNAGVITSFQRSYDYDTVHNREMHTLIDRVHIAAVDLMRVARTVSTKDDNALMVNALAGDDKVIGGKHDDRGYGYGGDDVITGRRGNDILNGGAGDDRLDGGVGRDTLRGSSGSDVFVYSIGYGKDDIMDFKPTGKGHDIVDLTGVDVVTNFHDLTTFYAANVGDDLVIQSSSRDILTLHNVSEHDLIKADFIFA